MKKKIIIWFFAAGAVIFFALSIAVSLFAKKIVLAQIKRNLKTEASLDSIGLRFPFFIVLNNLKIGSLFAAEKISFYPNLLGILAGKIVLGGLTVVNPVINLEQNSGGSFNLPEFGQKGKPPPVFITGLRVKNGRFIFGDRKIVPQGYATVVDKIDIGISKVMFPVTSLAAEFKCKAKVVDLHNAVLGDIDFSGWADFIKKDMDAVLKITDLDAAHFYPYYGDFLSNRKLLSARLDFESRIKAKNNDLSAVSRLRLSDLVYAQEQGAEQENVFSFDLTKNALDLFTDKEGNLDLNFTIRTKLDSPKIRITDLKAVVLRAAVDNLSRQDPQDVVNKVGDTVEQFKDFGRQMKEIFGR